MPPTLRLVSIALLVVLLRLATITAASATDKHQRVLFIGDSLTAGYGVAAEEAFPAKVQALAARDQLSIDTINAGISGDTTAGGLRRLAWVTKERPDVVVLCLGANDGLRGLNLENTKTNLLEIAARLRQKFVDVPILLLPMELPPTFGEPYTSQFREVFRQVSKEANLTLGPFLLDNVAGHRELNLPDGIHPNPRGHEVVAETVWPALKPLLAR